MHSSRQEITMGKKTKTIQEDLGIFTQILVYSGKFRILCKTGIFRILVYWKSETEASEPYLTP